MDASQEKHVRFTTFKRDGTPVSTAVWCVPLGTDRFGFWTSSGSGKAKRLAHTSRVLVQPSDGRGKPKAGSLEVEGTAEVVSGGPQFDEVKRMIKDKYGFLTNVTKFLAQVAGLVRRKRMPYGDRVVLVTIGRSTPG